LPYRYVRFGNRNISDEHRKIDRQTIFGYLLGTLDESDEMRFDELSITDDEFADALAAAENDLIDAHVRGELDQESSKQLKPIIYLATAVRKRDFARALQVFAETSQTKSETRQLWPVFFPRLGICLQPVHWSLGLRWRQF